MKPLSINIVGLDLKAHHFNFSLDDKFLEEYGQGFLPGGHFSVDMVLDKHETFIEAEFKINGTVKLTCDRSLEIFDYPIALEKKMLFKYGDHDEELTDEITIIARETSSLDLGQLVYEYIGISIPMKKLHPRFQEEEESEESEGRMVYSSSTDDKSDDESGDPIWEKLKKLK